MIHPARYTSLGEILDDAYRTYPTDTACIEVERDRENVRLTFQEFRTQSRQVGAWLAERGLTDGARVAIVMGNQAAWLLTAAAVLHTGGVLVPLDSRLDPAEIPTLLAHSGAQALFVDHHIHRKLNTDVPHVVVAGSPKSAPEGTTAFPDVLATEGQADAVPRTRDDVAAIVYSSGTGGDPKGCLLTHGNYLAQYQALMETFDWRRGDRYFSILPTNHAIDFMCGFIASFCTGTTVIWQRTLRPEYLLKTMRRYRVTQMAVVPLLLKAFERAIRDKLDDVDDDRQKVFGALKAMNTALTRRAPNHGLSRWLMKPVHDAFGGQLRILFCGGAFTDADRASFFAELGLPVAIGYGLTEACTVATVNDLRPFRGDSVGAPVPGVEVRIVDPGPDGIGEVQISGPTVFSGYLDDPEQTEATFDGDWLRTGDLGWIDGAHHLHLVGRRKNMIVTPEGKNVYPEDIENVFEDVDVEELCILAEDFVWPSTDHLGDERLIAVVRPKADKEATLAALAVRNRRLPGFKRIDGVVWWTADFPRTASMKVKRHILAGSVRDATAPDDVEALA